MYYKYYHGLISQTFRFIISPGRKVLFLGYPDVGVLPKKLYPGIKFVDKDCEKYRPKEKFDFIVLNGALGKTPDMLSLLKNIRLACHSSTRILVYQHNYLWQWLLTLMELLKLKRIEGIQNWLSVSDLRVYLEGAGYEVTRVFRKTIIPVRLWGVGEIINRLGKMFPFFDFLKLDQYIIARPSPELFPKNLPKSLTICLTVRNEAKNIESIVTALPKICNKQEILFVEGHSTDGTREEIRRMMKIYPKKNIKVMGQPGKGQGDAIRVGFKAAKGDIILLYEGDGTSDVRDLKYFYEAMSKGRFEFIEGSRFVYPMDPKAMPLPNKIGNIFFAKWFSFFLGQRTTDVLSGIKGILKRDYDKLYNQWGFLGFDDPFGDFELLYGAARMGLKIGEIPMRYYPRIYGRSKSNVLTHGAYLLRMAIKGYLIFRSN